jgi:2-C-methyl-D-erythritol 4-phosphate cytidylyltransferase/2-C-methyl-D-erythritol 2,4-cyclodiphosphate synthase
MWVSSIIAAGGRGLRMGSARPKQLLEVAGRAVLDWSVAAFASHPGVGEVVVALPPDLASDPPGYLRHASKPVRIVEGGARRQDSVARAFAAVESGAEVILVHDAARPLVSADLITRTIEAAADAGAALAAVPARDTVKRAGGAAGPTGFVVETLPRDTIYLAQTPQGFRRDVLRGALEAGRTRDATDEAALAEAAGYPVRIVEGEMTNIKITTPDDLAIAEAIVRGRGAARPVRTGRAGVGYDLHRLVPGRTLRLGGVDVESDRGALGHSDADVVCHAVTDAILGAASLGDIGRHFPDSDVRWKDASSLDLLARATTLLADAGYEIGNVDVTVILERPRISDHIDAMRRNLAAALRVDVGRVSVKGKTNEGLDAIGRSEAIAAHAVALVRSV